MHIASGHALTPCYIGVSCSCCVCQQAAVKEVCEPPIVPLIGQSLCRDCRCSSRTWVHQWCTGLLHALRSLALMPSLVSQRQTGVVPGSSCRMIQPTLGCLPMSLLGMHFSLFLTLCLSLFFYSLLRFPSVLCLLYDSYNVETKC